MTNCYNCGHTGTFVLLAQFALAVPEDGENASPSSGVSLAVQCPACDSTDVNVGATDLLARYGASTTS